MRFYETTYFLFNEKMEDLHGKGKGDIPCKVTLDLLNIISVGEGMNDDKDGVSDTRCVVFMKSGEVYLIQETYREMVDIWKGELKQ